MKKYLAYAASLGLAMSVNLALPTAASAEQPGNVQFCKLVVNKLGGDVVLNGTPFHFDNVGDCVSLTRTKPPVQTCKAIGDVFDALGIPFPFKNFGQCVKALGDV